MCFRFLCCCCCSQSKKKEVKWKSRKSKSPSSKQKLNQASSPSGLPTTDITQEIEIPNEEFDSPEDVANAYGFELLTNEDILGEGGYAKVIRAKRMNDNSLVAVKIMDISGKSAKKLRTDAKNELFILEKTNHPHIIRVFSHFIVHLTKEDKNFVYIFMRFAEKGSLSTYLRAETKVGMSEPLARKMFAQIVSAVAHMHSLGIAHRDLKLGNVLLDKDLNAMVADFGLSRVSFRKKKGTIKSTEFKGTITYMAPEILAVKFNKDRNRETSETETEKKLEYNTFYADVWALGSILYVMINRKYLFDIDKDSKDIKISDYKLMYRRQQNFENNPNVELSRYWKERSEEYEDLLKKLFIFDAEKRIKISEVCEHKWIRNEINLINDRIRNQN